MFGKAGQHKVVENRGSQERKMQGRGRETQSLLLTPNSSTAPRTASSHLSGPPAEIGCAGCRPLRPTSWAIELSTTGENAAWFATFQPLFEFAGKGDVSGEADPSKYGLHQSLYAVA